VKLLIDAQLPRRLARRLGTIGTMPSTLAIFPPATARPTGKSAALRTLTAASS